VKLKIAHCDVEVDALDPLTSDVADVRGLWLFNEKEILIDPRLVPQEQARVLIHEILHGIHECFRLESKPRSEEQICGDFDVPLATVFRDNPTLFAKLHQALCNGKPIVEG
jgi:hypothetical protein